MRRTPARFVRPLTSRTLAFSLTLALAACRASADAGTSGQVRYHGRTLAEWWPLRRDPDDATAGEARRAMRILGASAVPFLASKAAGPDLGDVIGGSVALESMCPTAIPAMESARGQYPSPALEQAIRRVQTRTDTAQVRRCAADADSGRAGAPR